MAPATEAPATTTAEGPTQHTLNQDALTALATLREPFGPHQISKLPKISCSKCSDAQYKVCETNGHRRERCDVCQSTLTTAHIHLDYVGHAELTGRLLDADPLWTWEPMAFDDNGLPKFDENGGLWIRLTVCGHTRIGYGDAQKKRGPNAVKEAIGDALRNAGMRFGAALALWSKTDMDEAHAEKEALSIEPSPEERLDELVVLMQKRWGHAGGLKALLQQLEQEELTEAQVPDGLTGGMRLFGELVSERLTHLEREAEQKAAVKRFVADIRKEWDSHQALVKRQAEASELGILDRQVPGPDGVIVSIEHLLTERLSSLRGGASSAPESTTGGAAAPSTAPTQDRAGHVRRLMAQVADGNCWNSITALQQIKGDAEHHNVFDEQVQGPHGTWMPMRTLVTVRIAELEQAAEDRNNERSAA
ncbi:hypothetical protein ACF06X_33460 [Streptomyces sp. NPDC015346]|uniref:hypothetical protein n=1 Tax=Streptomyces sp. NPDC015346 TaxID=3364954 RepID=UPI0036F9618A